jgi:hypothetical protein
LVIVTSPSLRRSTTSNPEERRAGNAGKYIVLDSDRVNCSEGTCRCGIVPVDLSSEGVEGHTW